VQDIFQVLRTTPNGKSVIGAYEKDGQFKKNTTRDVLVNCLMEHEVSEDTEKTYVISITIKISIFALFKNSLLTANQIGEHKFLIFVCFVGSLEKFLAKEIVTAFPKEREVMFCSFFLSGLVLHLKRNLVSAVSSFDCSRLHTLNSIPTQRPKRR